MRRSTATKMSDVQVEEEATVTLRAQVFYSKIFLKQEKDKRRVFHDLKLSGANNHVRQNAVKQKAWRS